MQTVHDHQTRFKSNELLAIPFCSTTRGQKSFLFKASKFWNELPYEIRKIENINEFKRKIKNHLVLLNSVQH